jgi:hypothetical protein
MAPASDPRPTAPTSDEAPARVAPRRGVVAVAWTNFTENFFSTVFVGVIVGVAMFGLGVVNDNINEEFAEVDARFAAVDARFIRLEENQLEMALTLARVVALLEARSDSEPAPAGHAPAAESDAGGPDAQASEVRPIS